MKMKQPAGLTLKLWTALLVSEKKTSNYIEALRISVLNLH